MDSQAVCRRLRALVLTGSLLAAAAATEGGTIHYCDTFQEIFEATYTAEPGDEIVIAPGEYHVVTPLHVTASNLTFRGETGNRDDVVLHGNGMNTDSGVTYGIRVAADGVRLHDLTIRDFWGNGILIGDTSSYANDLIISNVKTLDCGRRHVMGYADSRVSYGVLIENLWMEQTQEYIQGPGGHPVNNVGGIEATNIHEWTIRDCVAKNIRDAEGTGQAAFLLWNGVSDLLLERNVVVRCGHGIAIGNYPPPDSHSHTLPWHAVEGIVRNNIILRRGESADDRAMELDYTMDFEVFNNTVYSEDASHLWTLRILDDWTRPGQTTNLVLVNNIIRGGILDQSTGDWSPWVVADYWGNIVDFVTPVLPEWFLDPAGGELHLTRLATALIDQAQPLWEVPDDIDGGPRPAGAGYDYGADEFASPMGDANYDGCVDGLDYNNWSLHYLQAGGWPEGDFNSDGEVDGLDYNLWSLHYLEGCGAGVPEPAALTLLALGGLALIRRRAATVKP
ncbi:MAG: hypothetical protein AMJ81_01340 [Phycisphaerae bacterium SM23_33]|nr:MAG: hypothetical protein AMJ81_01340 [Phycisphaerae bacterium SM23_33]